MWRRFVTLLLILFAAVASGAAEISVSDFTLRNAPGSKRLPAIAAGDGGYLAAWLDERSGPRVLIATRVAPNGEALDPLGIPLGRAAFYRPQILWSGDGYLVLWNEGNRVMISRVSRDGRVDGPRTLLSPAWLDQRPRAIATNGSHIVIGYTGLGRMLHIAVLTLEGVLLSDRIIDDRTSGTPTVLANDDEFLVTWAVAGSNGQADLLALRLDSRGAPTSASPRKIGEGWDAEVLRNGENYVVVGRGPNYESWSVSRDLTSIGPAAALPLNHYDRDPSMLDGSPAMMAVFESSESAFVTAITFDANGHEVRPRKRIAQTGPSQFAVARGDDALAVVEVKSDDDNGADAIIGSVFDDTTFSREAPDRSLALSASEEDSPVIASGKGRYLAVWTGPQGITAGRFLQDGTRLDGSGFVVDPLAADTSWPAVVFDGERFVVTYHVWANNRSQTFVRFVSPTEGLLPAIESFESRSAPTLEVGDGVVLVTWMDWEGVFAATMRGTQLSAPPRLIAASQGSEPVAKWNGRQFLVAWNEADFDYDMLIPTRIRSMRIASDLSLLDAQPRVLLENYFEPVLGAWKRGWVIAFDDGDNIRLHEIDESGRMIDAPLATVQGSFPKFVNTASQPWLAWSSFEQGLLNAAPIQSDGTLGASLPLATAAPRSPSFGYDTALASLGNDVAAVYARLVPEAGSVRRVFVSVNERPMRRRAVR